MPAPSVLAPSVGTAPTLGRAVLTTPAVSGGTRAGDYLVAVISTDAPPGTATPPAGPAGWTRLLGSQVRLHLFYRRLTAPVAASVTHTFTQTGRTLVGQLLVVRGADSSIFIGGSAWHEGDPPSTRPAITTSRRNSTVLWLQRAQTAGYTASYPAMAGASSRARSGSSRAENTVAWYVWPSRGPTGAFPTPTGHRPVSHAAIELRGVNLPPDAPTVAVPDPVDLNAPVTVTVTASDPDPGDSTSAVHLRWRVEGTSTWTTTVYSGTSTALTIPRNTFTADRWELQAATRDQDGAPTVTTDLRWSPSVLFDAATRPAGPVFTSPTAGAVIPTSSQEWTVSHADLDALEWRVRSSTGTVYGSGTNTSEPLREFTVSDLPNGASVIAEARAERDGLWGPWTTQTHAVSYTPPAQTPFVLEADPVEFAIGVYPRVPVPAGTQPAVTEHDLYVRRLESRTQTRIARLAPGEPFVWRDPASLAEYEFRLATYGQNGTLDPGVWSAVSTVVELPDDPDEPTSTIGTYDEGTYDQSTYG